MAITASGTIVQASGTGVHQLTVQPAAIGNAFLLGMFLGSTSVSAQTVTGGSCTWQRIVTPPVTDSVMIGTVELWLGVATSTTQAALSVVGTGSGIGSLGNQLSVQQFGAGLGATTVWTPEDVGGIDQTTNTQTLTFPTLTPRGPGRLYFGFAVPQFNGQNIANAGGLVWQNDNFTDRMVYNLSISAATSPAGATQDQNGHYMAVAAVLNAALPSVAPPPPPPRVARQAVQRASLY